MLKLEPVEVNDNDCHHSDYTLKHKSELELRLGIIIVPVVDQLLERLAVHCFVVQLVESSIQVLRCIGKLLEFLSFKNF